MTAADRAARQRRLEQDGHGQKMDDLYAHIEEIMAQGIHPQAVEEDDE